MTPQIQAWVKKAKTDFIKKPGKVLEIGSLNFNGGVREFFSDASSYIGTDMQEGEGVDLVINAHDLLKEFKKESFDTILCLETFEHDDKFWLTLENIKALIKKNGFLIITTPTFGFPLHRFPKDYFRFGEDAFRDIFFKDYRIINLEEVKDSEGNSGICAIGQKL